ncbi:MAG: hypothetical protein AAF250_05790 [Pseudomonadota bacterium]
MDVVKAMLLAVVLTYSVALVVGTQGSSGGYLDVHSMAMGNSFKVFWSWPLFLAGTGLSWGIMLLQK